MDFTTGYTLRLKHQLQQKWPRMDIIFSMVIQVHTPHTEILLKSPTNKITKDRLF